MTRRVQQSKRRRAQKHFEQEQAERERLNWPTVCQLCQRILRQWERPEGLCDSCARETSYRADMV